MFADKSPTGTRHCGREEQQIQLLIYWYLWSNQLSKKFIREIQFAGFKKLHVRTVLATSSNYSRARRHNREGK